MTTLSVAIYNKDCSIKVTIPVKRQLFFNRVTIDPELFLSNLRHEKNTFIEQQISKVKTIKNIIQNMIISFHFLMANFKELKTSFSYREFSSDHEYIRILRT